MKTFGGWRRAWAVPSREMATARHKMAADDGSYSSNAFGSDEEFRIQSEERILTYSKCAVERGDSWLTIWLWRKLFHSEMLVCGFTALPCLSLRLDFIASNFPFITMNANNQLSFRFQLAAQWEERRTNATAIIVNVFIRTLHSHQAEWIAVFTNLNLRKDLFALLIKASSSTPRSIRQRDAC